MPAKTFPVVEVFGPTVQGEGVEQGAPTHFVRFGGCDYACVWCDTPYAVLPQEVRKAEKLTAREIVDRVGSLRPAGTVVLSGGNPALLELDELVTALQTKGYRVMAETQGSKWKHWLRMVDQVCVSFKPPSSQQEKSTLKSAELFINTCINNALRDWYVKIVVFSHTDFEWATRVHSMLPDYVPFCLSAGNDAGATVGWPDRVDERGLTEVREDLLNQTRWLTELVLRSPLAAKPNARVQNQLHTALWGNVRGV